MSNVVTSHPTPAQLKKTWSQRAGAEVKDLADSTGKIVIVDFLAGMVMFAVGVPVAGLPLGTLAAVGLVLLAFTRRSRAETKYSGIFLMVMGIALCYVAANSFLIGIPLSDIARRVFRISIVLLLAVFIANKRIDFKSVILGLAAGLVINVPAFYAGIAPNNYGGVLTGWLNDKNQAGLYYAVVGFLLVTLMTKRWHQVASFILFSGLLWLTGSRTSMAAFALGLLWIFLARRANLLVKTGLAYFMVWIVNFLETNFAQAGEFANRAGSDALRERIDEASKVKLDAAPWNGMGLGTATVDLGDNLRFFFHNSFWTLLVEGGWIYLGLVMLISIVTVFIAHQASTDMAQKRILIAEGGMVLIFICSWRLGEVLLTVPWGLVIGLALSLTAAPLVHPGTARYLKKSGPQL